MKIQSSSRGEININTPIDDPTQYDPDWRHRLSRVFVENPSLQLPEPFRQLKYDPWIQKHVSFLRDLDSGREFKPIHNANRLAFKWSQGTIKTNTRFRLEPLLLTPVSYSVIAQGLSGGELNDDPFITYEKLFFNIRNKAGILSKSCHLRSYFALPSSVTVTKSTAPDELWKVTAAQHGYKGLIRMWIWADAPEANETESADYMSQEAWRTAQALSLERLVRGEMSDFDLTTWIGKYTENEKMRRETSSNDSPAAKMATLLASVLQQAAPKVLTVAKTVDELDSQTALLQERFKAQRPTLPTGKVIGAGESDPQKDIAIVKEMLHTTFKS